MHYVTARLAPETYCGMPRGEPAETYDPGRVTCATCAARLEEDAQALAVVRTEARADLTRRRATPAPDSRRRRVAYRRTSRDVRRGY